MKNQNDKEKVSERIKVGFGLVAFPVVLFATAVDLDPIVLWMVS